MAFQPQHFNVWAEIPVTDMEKGVAYYGAVLQADMKIDESGPNPMAMFPVQDLSTGISGHIYPGKPASNGQGTTVHLSIDGKLEDAMERVKAAGGTVVSEPVPMPFGRFAYTIDPFGNSVGLFEAA